MTSVLVGLYRGRSLISRAIRWRTWSPYSHASLIRVDGAVIESWHRGGVQRRACWDDGHSEGTPIDLFAVDATLGQQERAWSFAESQVGLGYDWRAIWGFVARRDSESRDRWFCSELVAAAFAAAGVDLLARMPYAQIAPGDLAHSPRLRLLATVVTR